MHHLKKGVVEKSVLTNKDSRLQHNQLKGTTVQANTPKVGEDLKKKRVDELSFIDFVGYYS